MGDLLTTYKRAIEQFFLERESRHAEAHPTEFHFEY